MKSIFVLMLTLSTLPAFATTVSNTVARIELEENAKCEKTSQSRFQICSGTPDRTCLYSVKLSCVSNSGDFRLKLRVKESTNFNTLIREAKVWKVIYYR